MIVNSDYGVLIRTCWRLAAELRPRLVAIYMLLVAANGFLLVQPVIIGHIVKIVADGHGGLLTRVYPWLIAMVCATAAHFACQVPARMMERRAAFTMRQRLTDELYAQVTGLPWSWHQNHHSGNTINRITYATQSIYTFTDEHFLLVQICVRLIGSIGFLLWVSPAAGLVILAAVPSLFLLLRGFNKSLQAISERQNQAEHEITAGLFDYLSNIVTVLTLRLQAASRAELARRFGIVERIYTRYVDINEIKWAAFSTLMEMASAVAVLLYLSRHYEDSLAVVAGTVAAILQYLQQINLAIRYFADRQQQLMSFRVKIDGTAAISTAAQTATSSPHSTAAAQWRTARLDEISFRYDDQDHHIHRLEDVGMTLERGQRVALVGESGSGKSTLLRVLRGLHTPSSGRLTLDGAASSLSVLAEVTTLVPQDAEIFDNTVRYNVTCGIARDTGLEQAVEMANFDTVARALPHGLDTDIRERGVNLSGGQKQRLALARGLFAARDSSILLLDEPTSSLDPVTEALVYDRIFAGFPDACIVSSVHRLHLLNRFDYIYVLQAGRVAEEGSFEALIARDGKLTAMWNAQQRETADSSG